MIFGWAYNIYQYWGSKSVGVCIKIYACSEILLNDHVKSEYLYWGLI